MEDYIKKMPLLLSLGTGIILGMFFLYNKKVLTDVFPIILISVIFIYIIGRFLGDVLMNIYNSYIAEKKSHNIGENKEGKNENLANILNESQETQSKLDLKVETTEDDFVELTKNIPKE